MCVQCAGLMCAEMNRLEMNRLEMNPGYLPIPRIDFMACKFQFNCCPHLIWSVTDSAIDPNSISGVRFGSCPNQPNQHVARFPRIIIIPESSESMLFPNQTICFHSDTRITEWNPAPNCCLARIKIGGWFLPSQSSRTGVRTSRESKIWDGFPESILILGPDSSFPNRHSNCE